MHGGIGRSINSVEQIEKLERPITMDAGSIILMDLLWYLFFVYPSFFCHVACYVCVPFPIFSLRGILNCNSWERLPSPNPTWWAWCELGHLFFVTISMGLCRSDPTENDSVEGLRPNARGPGLVTFGVSICYLSL